MCGIIGYCGPRRAAPILLEGLKRLEYRGYDSAGIALATPGCTTAGEGADSLGVIKARGKIKDLKALVPPDIAGTTGIGHTRWATHGEVTDANAHPHLDGTGDFAIVHNGVIENFHQLRDHLLAQGVEFHSETDSEVIVHLLARAYQGDLVAALTATVSLLKGTYGIVAMYRGEPGRLVGARNGSPLVLGIGQGEMFLASDTTAILGHTRQVIYLEDGEVVSLTADEYATSDLMNREIRKEVDHISWELESIEKTGFTHFMEKEIYEQPEAIRRALRGRLDREYATGHLGGLNLNSRELLEVGRIVLLAAGTSYHAGMVATYALEELVRVPAVAELASELRYRNPLVERDALYFAASQSGETADTLYAMREVQRKGGRVLGICNVVGSTIARESDGGVYIHSGPEISVASTKAFTSQLAAFYVFALLMGRMRHLSHDQGLRLIEALEAVPGQIEAILAHTEPIRALARRYASCEHFFFLGRGINYPVALEAALKLKEVSYIHAEGYSAAEIKHGPLALITEETPSVFLVPRDGLREKVITSMKEVKARRGPVIALAVEGDQEVARVADEVLYVPEAHHLMYPFLLAVPAQLFAYYCALERGCNVDQPRNLAKSVTVE
ncbi:glutamine--fructose-6-phosphate aminotransferase [Alkalispirochaeta sphaeroplastigenens]|uniref:Glutamine--fructose-6-phosphate aminotransferase [isomerizing] n=1 Tax=Alkalispirochaeta sphaeroplastigenens TaxID=1187066 RepID=A0A2S4JX21_9SPIO|nr:glutamine--fructose-6-phosphate transaminase (isomerizing) [Alkalispirochaeta sphaeroplastigenens]POR04075.1 glutamine--fructose-6-phosphate aminotransferase [Alkalispirochaeta sphaeroplastigenens]